jgi:hypothetical protein
MGNSPIDRLLAWFTTRKQCASCNRKVRFLLDTCGGTDCKLEWSRAHYGDIGWDENY